MLLSKCTLCNNKKSRFIEKQEENGFLSELGIRTPLVKIQLLGIFCF